MARQDDRAGLIPALRKQPLARPLAGGFCLGKQWRKPLLRRTKSASGQRKYLESGCAVKPLWHIVYQHE
jgi:hypothetical protein